MSVKRTTATKTAQEEGETSPTPAGRVGRHMTPLNESASELSEDVSDVVQGVNSRADELQDANQSSTIEEDEELTDIAEEDGSESSGSLSEEEEEEGEESDEGNDSSFEVEQEESIDSISVASTPPKPTPRRASRVSRATATPAKAPTKITRLRPSSVPLGESVRQSTPAPESEEEFALEGKAIIDDVSHETGAAEVPASGKADTAMKKKKR